MKDVLDERTKDELVAWRSPHLRTGSENGLDSNELNVAAKCSASQHSTKSTHGIRADSSVDVQSGLKTSV